MVAGPKTIKVEEKSIVKPNDKEKVEVIKGCGCTKKEEADTKKAKESMIDTKKPAEKKKTIDIKKVVPKKPQAF